MNNYQQIFEKAKPIILQTGEFIRAERKKFESSDIEFKGTNNLVSYVDKTAEKQLVEGLGRILPGSGFITEEDTEDRPGERFTWIIDPLDGTTNFIHGLPPFSISVALQEQGRTVLGMVYEINLDELFYAWEGGNAFLNGKAIRVSAAKELSQALLVTGFPYNDMGKMDAWLKIFKNFALNSRGVRRLGSAAVDLAYVACGRLDAFYEYGLNSWDVAAGAFIVQQAGGNVCDFNGNDKFIARREMVAGNGKIHQEVLNVIRNKF